MLVDSGSSAVGSTVTGAIRQASSATGTSFSYLLATAQVESGLDPRAGASTSSARGLFQFVEQTWLGTIKQSGAALGYSRYADAITKTASGHYTVKDPALRSQILKLRNDPTANAVMAGAFTRANAAYLTQKLGRTPSEGELYIAHFLGASGAAHLITLAASNPNAKAAAFFGPAASANPSIFFDRKGGGARSVAQVRDVLTARYDVARLRPQAPAVAAQAARGPLQASAPLAAPLSIVPDTAGIANAFAAAAPPTAAAAAPSDRRDDQMFYRLFADAGKAAAAPPAAPAAPPRRLWTVPNSTAIAPGAAAPPPVAAATGFIDLFKDPEQRS